MTFKAERGLGCWRFWRKGEGALVLSGEFNRNQANAIRDLCDEAFAAGRAALQAELWAALNTSPARTKRKGEG